MWLLLAFFSAALLGLYDTCKKKALNGNAVIPVLLANTVVSSLIFLPLILLSGYTDILDGSIFHVGQGGWDIHKYIILKRRATQPVPMVGGHSCCRFISFVKP